MVAQKPYDTFDSEEYLTKSLQDKLEEHESKLQQLEMQLQMQEMRNELKEKDNNIDSVN